MIFATNYLDYYTDEMRMSIGRLLYLHEDVIGAQSGITWRRGHRPDAYAFLAAGALSHFSAGTLGGPMLSYGSGSVIRAPGVCTALTHRPH